MFILKFYHSCLFKFKNKFLHNLIIFLLILKQFGSLILQLNLATYLNFYVCRRNLNPGPNVASYVLRKLK